MNCAESTNAPAKRGPSRTAASASARTSERLQRTADLERAADPLIGRAVREAHAVAVERQRDARVAGAGAQPQPADRPHRETALGLDRPARRGAVLVGVGDRPRVDEAGEREAQAEA